MARQLSFSVILLISIVFILSPLYAQKKAQGTEEDVEELEALIEGRKPAAKATKVKTAPPHEAVQKPVEPREPAGSFYKSFGNGMSIRGDGKYFYIQAKDTVITVDATGHVQIEAADNILMKSRKSITLQADETINLVSGEGVVQSKLAPKPKKVSESVGSEERKPAQAVDEGIVETEIEGETPSKEPAAQLPPKGEVAEEAIVEEEKKAQEPESAPAVGAPAGAERSEPFEESESESTLENE